MKLKFVAVSVKEDNIPTFSRSHIPEFHNLEFIGRKFVTVSVKDLKVLILSMYMYMIKWRNLNVPFDLCI